MSVIESPLENPGSSVDQRTVNRPLRVLIVEDSPDDVELLVRELRKGGYRPDYLNVATPEGLRAALDQGDWEIVISDWSMPQFNGLDAFRIVHERDPDVPFIILSGTIGEEVAVAALKAGVQDFMTKGKFSRLAPAVERELRESSERRRRRVAETELEKRRQDIAESERLLRLEVVERQRVAEGLRDSESRFRQMAENINDVFFLRDADGNGMLYISPAYEEIWGRSCESVYLNQESWSEAIHPDDRASANQHYLQGLSSGKAEYEYRIVRPDGSIRWIHTRSFAVRDEAGRIVRIAGVAKDVTEHKRTQEAILASEIRYRLLFEASPLPMWVYDLSSLVFLAVNDAAVEHYGYSREQFLAMTIADIRREEDLPALQKNLSIGFTGVNHSGVWRHRKRDGAIIEVEITSHVIDFSGRLSRLVLANDVTERFEQQRKIARMNRIRAVTTGISSAMLRLTDRNELLQEACRVATTDGVFPIAWVSAIDSSAREFKIVGFHGKDAQAIDVIKLAASEAIPELDRPSYRAAQTGRPLVINDLSTDATVAPIRAQLLRRSYRSLAAFPLLVDARVVAVLVLLAEECGFFDAEEIALLESLTADLSFALEHIQQSERLDYFAYYDALTGLPNVRLFSDRLEQLVHAARRDQGKVCVVVIDLERFTQINDTFGRDVGDEVLSQVGARFGKFLVEPYALGRIGADTFAVASPRDAETIDTKLRERMLDALKQPFRIGDTDVHVAAQAGIALFPADGDDGNSVFKNAEAALKLAKSSDERYAYHSSETNSRIMQRLALQEQLSTAIDTQQFVLHYQPRVDMTSGEVVGAEALIRWEHPARGLVGPFEFITLAEETGLIVPIGSWVIGAVCAQQAVWIAAGLDTVPIAVNLSSVQFETGDLLQTVRDALATYSLDPKLLELELTESAVMNDAAAAAKTLNALRKLGVGLALDDFGTGYSSLAHLKHFPFSSVKIDRSFVTDITRNADDAAIATAVIAMAHRMELKVIAEGVETQGQFNYLRAQACDEMQGFFYSPAITKELFEFHLRSRKRLILPTPEPTDQRTLLIVDDEEGIRGALRRVLRRDGYRILTAASASDALDLLAVNRVQVIISDQRMPGTSGTEFLGIATQLYPDTVRIILSGYMDLKVVTDSVNRGSVFKFLTKPWDDDLLRAQVRDAFRRYRPELNHSRSFS